MIASKSIVVEIADSISQRGRRNCVMRVGERSAVFPGFVPSACSQKGIMGTREIRLVQAELVGSDKLTMRGRSDDHAEVRLADSTLRSGEPVTWGSGQQVVNRSKET